MIYRFFLCPFISILQVAIFTKKYLFDGIKRKKKNDKWTSGAFATKLFTTVIFAMM